MPAPTYQLDVCISLRFLSLCENAPTARNEQPRPQQLMKEADEETPSYLVPETEKFGSDWVPQNQAPASEQWQDHVPAR